MIVRGGRNEDPSVIGWNMIRLRAFYTVCALSSLLFAVNVLLLSPSPSSALTVPKER